MIASSMNAEVLMLQRALEVRQGRLFSGYQRFASFGLRSDFEDFLI
jgi:hypothetical protein